MPPRARRLRIAALTLGASLLALVLAGFGARALWRSRTYQLFGELVPRVQTAERVVALTIDDGPDPRAADEILRALRETGTRATFYVIGAQLAEQPEIGRRLVAEGHELGNHTWSHHRMVLKSSAFIRREVESTDSLIRAVGHRGPITFRPPGGVKLVGLPRYLARTGRVTVMWDIEPDSYPEVAASAERITAHVLDRVRPGSIILLHAWYPSRRESLRALRLVVAGLAARGYRLVTVSELLGIGDQGSGIGD